MTLKDLVMTLVPSGILFIRSKDEEPLQTIKAIDATNIEEELLNKEVLSIAPTYTLDGNKILGCLMIKINFAFIKEKENQKWSYVLMLIFLIVMKKL